ncbi:MAG: protein translocase SEC61 complex subunit gamma [Candidatus Aenigmarchaeota archaeon]|nr:protein translocase SEC61 complex subunit gamma [Candidatus Aenigmarchaeota archaeon]
MGKMKDFLKNCIRVLKITKKPSKEEYFALIKITGIGILLIGFIGFLIYLIFTLMSIFG